MAGRMIVRVVLAAEMAKDLGDARDPTTDRLSTVTARTLVSQCRLVLDSKATRIALLKGLRGKSTIPARALVELLANDRYVDVLEGRTLGDTPLRTELEAWGEDADLVVVASELHKVLMQEGELPELPEACTYWGVTGTAAIGELRELWAAPVHAGSKRETVWKERFELHALEAREVYIIDHFAGDQVTQAHYETGRPAPHGVTWFLKKLAGTRVKKVSLATEESAHYTRAGKRLGTLETKEAFAALAKSSGLGDRLRVSVIAKGKDFDHERSIAFDKRIAFSPHNGLATFGEATFTKGFALAASYSHAADVIRNHKEWRRREC